MLHTLRLVAGLLLTATLAAAPWLYGGSNATAVLTLSIAVTICAGLWLVSISASNRKSLPRRIRYAAILISLGCWVSFFLSTGTSLDTFTSEHIARIAARWPRSILVLDPALAAWFASIVPLVTLMIADFAREIGWRKQLVCVLVLSGGLIAALGIWQNAEKAQGIFFEKGIAMPGAFFATFYHHTSAGAFLNIIWPLAAGLLLGCIMAEKKNTVRVIALGILSVIALGVLLAAHAAHVSRFPQVAAIISAGIGGVLVLGSKSANNIIRTRFTLFAIIGIFLVAIVGWTGSHGQRLSEIVSRWEMFYGANTISQAPKNAPEGEWVRLMRDDLFVESNFENYFWGDRGAMFQTGLAAAKDAGAWGGGAGSWPRSQATHTDIPFLRTFYLCIQFAHQDALQTIVEFGWIGFAGWLFLVGGGLIVGLRFVVIYELRNTKLNTNTFLTLGAVVSLLALLAQSLIDFPLQIPAIRLQVAALVGMCWAAWLHSLEAGPRI